VKRIYLIFILSFAVGIFAGSFIGFGIYLGLLFVLLGGVFLIFRFLNDESWLLKASIIFLALGLGLIYFGFRDAQSRSVIPLLEDRIGEQVVLRGIIVDEPDEREKYTRLIFKSEDGPRVLVYAQHYPQYKYGDKVEIKGKIRCPKDFSQDFSWEAYLAKDDIFFEMFYPEIGYLSSGNGFFIKEKLFFIKEKFLESISRHIPEPHVSLLGGLTVGARRSMPEKLQEDFRKTGIIHIVVLSGYNVTIVADAIIRIFGFLPYFVGIGLGILGIIFFALMTGASATIVRASMMAILVILARSTGRVYQITLALFAAGFFMILHNPKILRFDSSFQLSFLATLALIYVVPIIEPKLKFLPKNFKLREFAAATIGTQIFVLPLLLYKMGLFSVVSVPVNLLILVFVPITMLFGFLTAMAGFFSSVLAAPISWITYGLLEYQLKVVEVFSNIPFSSFTIPFFPACLMISTYAVYGLFIYKLHK